ncbi:hypothetical protein [Deferrisoma camini]|uniref:hypothetical protein n=1 Tax=Deferrisoma camini TaxID=1035120 RepID=UPI00046D4AE3|nr:hypothetical protein [Deferrisoma camini]
MTDRDPAGGRPPHPDPAELEQAGWVRRSVASEPRLSEIVETYRSLGYEVRLLPAAAVCGSGKEGAACTACFDGDPDPNRYQVVLTRELEE